MKTDKTTCEQVARAALGAPGREHGRELYWRCPNHEDNDPSLQVNAAKNVWMCGPCGAKGNWWQLAGFIAHISPDDKVNLGAWLAEKGILKDEDQHGDTETQRKKSAEKAELLREHVYCLVDGTPVAKKIRWGSSDATKDKKLKKFTWQRWENGKWENGLATDKQAALPLYRVDQLAAAAFADAVVLTEGEHDADAGASIGLLTTTTGGTGAFSQKHVEYLTAVGERKIVIVAHGDAAGRAEAEKRAALLHGKGRSADCTDSAEGTPWRAPTAAARVKVVEIPGCKDLAEGIDKGITRELFDALIDDAKEWRPATGADLLDAVEAMLRRFVALEQDQLTCAVVWVAHTHAIVSADYTPYLAITSAEKQCGKSRLLQMLEFFAANPMRTASISPSALYRAIEKWQPTLLIDEADTAFQGDKETAEALRGVLNAGYQRGLYAIRNAGTGANMEPEKFSTFGAKAIAGIGHLDDTITSRSIPIRLERARKGEVERLRSREIKREAEMIATRLAVWVQGNLDELAGAHPAIPDELDGREADMCEPLLAVVDLAGGAWPERTRKALVIVCEAGRMDESSYRTKLLGHMRMFFYRVDVDGIGTETLDWGNSKEILEFLSAPEDWPWGEMGKSKKPITSHGLARMLGPYKIHPQQRKIDGKNERGYAREQFEDKWERYGQTV